MILQGDCRDVLPTIEQGIVQCVVTSPPYWGLRSYLDDDHPDKAREIGGETTIDAYLETMVGVFSEVRRVLRDDGTLWLNVGDGYATGGRGSGMKGDAGAKQRSNHGALLGPKSTPPKGLKQKDLCGMPWRLAFALQADGWYLRSDIIWCLSGGARVYAQTQKGEMPVMVKDLVRLDPDTVKLWNGEKWTQALGWSQTDSPDGGIEIELRSGECIACTPEHVWPTERGELRADELVEGDVIASCDLPEPDKPHAPAYIDNRLAWLIGLYLAEGSADSTDTLQFAGNADELDLRMEHILSVVSNFGGTARPYLGPGKSSTINVDCAPLLAIIRQYIHGNKASNKGLKVRCWKHSNEWLEHLLDGYLHGDGHHDAPNNRWRLGFTRNDRLAADFRTLSARLGFTLTLRKDAATGFGKQWPIYRGELRKIRIGHHNEKSRFQIVRIGKGRARQFWDIGVEDEPHLFALASGVLTHNSKPNPMPESVTDRPTKAHEYVFLLTKSQKYFYDCEAVREIAVSNHDSGNGFSRPEQISRGGRGADEEWTVASAGGKRNCRDVWAFNTEPYPGDHFAVFPQKLVERCIMAGTSEKGACADCGAPLVREVERQRTLDGEPIARGGWETDEAGRLGPQGVGHYRFATKTATKGWGKSCACDGEKIIPCTVLDPFLGTGTVGQVAERMGRRWTGIELSPNYVEQAKKRTAQRGLFMSAQA